MATHSSIAWRIPWREEPGRLQSTGSQRVRLSDFTFTFCKWIAFLRGRAGTVLGLCYSTWASLVVVCGLSCPAGCEILVHQGLKPRPCIRRWILNHWTTREVPGLLSEVFRCIVMSVTLYTVEMNTPEVLFLPLFSPTHSWQSHARLTWGSRHESGTHSPVMIVNGSREGTNTDAAASQVDHFTQEVFESERDRKRFIVQLRALLWNNTKLQGVPSTEAYYVLKYEHSSILKVPLKQLGQNSNGGRFPSWQILDQDKLRQLWSWPHKSNDPTRVSRVPWVPQSIFSLLLFTFSFVRATSVNLNASMMENHIETLKMKWAAF